MSTASRPIPGGLRGAGLAPTGSLGNHKEASHLRLDVGTGYQYWVRFAELLRHHPLQPSTHYAMAVWQLALPSGDARGGY